MTDLYFTNNGAQHFIRILAVDTKPGEVTVYEALVDGREYVNFEFHPETSDVYELFEHAIKAYRAHKAENTTIQTRWRD
jgi:hypothetical protein